MNKDQLPVIVINWMWGSFGDVSGGLETLLIAYVAFMRRTSAKVKLDLGFPQMTPQFLSISVGGAPPLDFMEKWVELRAAHFPEHITRGVLYPLKEESTRGQMVVAFINSAKMNGLAAGSVLEMVSTPAELIRRMNVTDGFIPDELLHMSPPTSDQSQAAVKQRSDLIMPADLERSEEGAIGLQIPVKDAFTVQVKNTFIHVETEPRQRRRHSFSGSPTNAGAESLIGLWGFDLDCDPISPISPHSRNLEATHADTGPSFIGKCEFVDVHSQRSWADLSETGACQDQTEVWPGCEAVTAASKFRAAACNLDAAARAARAAATEQTQKSQDSDSTKCDSQPGFGQDSTSTGTFSRQSTPPYVDEEVQPKKKSKAKSSRASRQAKAIKNKKQAEATRMARDAKEAEQATTQTNGHAPYYWVYVPEVSDGWGACALNPITCPAWPSNT